MTDWAIALHEYFGDEALSQLDDSLCSDMTSYEAVEATWKNLLPIPTKEILEAIYKAYESKIAVINLSSIKTNMYDREVNISWHRHQMPSIKRHK